MCLFENLCDLIFIGNPIPTAWADYRETDTFSEKLQRNSGSKQLFFNVFRVIRSEEFTHGRALWYQGKKNPAQL